MIVRVAAVKQNGLLDHALADYIREKIDIFLRARAHNVMWWNPETFDKGLKTSAWDYNKQGVDRSSLDSASACQTY